MSTRFLVTGGAGFLGINLIRMLLEEGHGVVSLDTAAFDYPEAGHVRAVRGDIRDRETVSGLVRQVDMVIHCAAALPLYSEEEILSTEVEGTRILLKESLAAGIRRFIHISTTAVYGVPDHVPVREEDPLVGVGPYGRAKIEAEELCRSFRSQGLVVPVIRPKSFVGPERLGVFALLYDWAADGRHFPVLGRGTNRYQLLDVEDLCRLILLCAFSDATMVNDTFNCGAEDYGTFRSDLQAVLDEAGFGRKVIPLPVGPAVMLLKIFEKLGISPLYAWVYETAAKDSVVDIEKVKEKLGFVPGYSNAEALIRNYRWYLSHRDEILGQEGVTHRTPWKQGILSVAKRFF